MKKRFLSVWLFALCAVLIMSSVTGFAESVNLSKVESIIAGKQDKLVFGTIVSVSGQVCSVSVVDDVGETKTTAGADSAEDSEPEKESLVGKDIDVVGFESYMYYEGFDHRPKLGDNVLLSLNFNGNFYLVKNGAFVVSEASYHSFSFIVPDTIVNTSSEAELTALYMFVSSNGLNADYEVENSEVYTHNIANGEKTLVPVPTGISFVNEKGETTKEAENSNMPGFDVGQSYDSLMWVRSLIIIVLGAVVGIFIVKLLLNIENRSESK